MARRLATLGVRRDDRVAAFLFEFHGLHLENNGFTDLASVGQM
jgi:hypothetical protein